MKRECEVCNRQQQYFVIYNGKLTCDYCISNGGRIENMNQKQLVMFMAAGYGNVSGEDVEIDDIPFPALPDAIFIKFHDKKAAYIFHKWANVNHFNVSMMEDRGPYVLIYYWGALGVNK